MIPEEEIRINGRMDYTTTSTQMFKIYGNPMKTEKIYWEMPAENVLKYSYPGAEFLFERDKLESFKLFSSDWSVENTKFKLRVGNNIKIISRYNPDAYSNRQNGNLIIPLGTGDYKFLLIEYDSTNKITVIEQRYF